MTLNGPPTLAISALAELLVSAVSNGKPTCSNVYVVSNS